jgi:hypothetical protein
VRLPHGLRERPVRAKSIRARPVHMRAYHLSNSWAQSVDTRALGSRLEMVEISADKRNARLSELSTCRESTSVGQRAKQVYRSRSSRSRVSTSERERLETAFGRVFKSFGRPADNGRIHLPIALVSNFLASGSYLVARLQWLPLPLRPHPLALPLLSPLLFPSPLSSSLHSRLHSAAMSYVASKVSEPEFERASALPPLSLASPSLTRLRHLLAEAVAEIRSTLEPLFAKRPELEKAFEGE